MRKPIALSMVVLLPALLFSGCSDPNKAKQELESYLTKKAEIKRYVFTGDADIELGTIPPTKDANPITASLVSMFMNGKMEWNGVSSIDPVRLEANLKSTPAAASAPLELPMLIKDNKMYISFPLINKKDEFFAIDMDKLDSTAGKPLLSPDSLKSITELTGSIATAWMTDIQGKWVKKSEGAATFQDGTKGNVYTVEITDKNKSEMTDIIRKRFPDWIASLQSRGVLTTEQADKLKQKTITLDASGQLSFSVDAQGFVRDESIRLPYTESDNTGTLAHRHLNIHQSYEQINQDVKFEKDVPKTTKPFEDVLRLLGNGNK